MQRVRFFWLAASAASISIFFYLTKDLILPADQFYSQSLEYQIQQDLEAIKSQNLIPPEFKDLKGVYLRDHRTEKAPINWDKLILSVFPLYKNGNYDLQIELFDTFEHQTQPSEPNYIIVQYSLFDAKTINKLFELSRKYSPQNSH